MFLKDILFWAMYAISFYLSTFIIITFFERNIAARPKNGGKLPSVSVIVPAYNEGETIAGTLDSLLSLDYPKKLLQLIVVNDGSTDRTRGIVEKKYIRKGVILINEKNAGKGAAMNNGLRRAHGELVACLDADSFVQKDTLKRMAAYFGDKSVAAVTPVLKVSSPANLIQKAQWLEYVLFTFIKMILASIQCLNVTPGPFSIYRRSALVSVGGFDEKSIVEDQEIACRLQKHNYKILQSLDGNVLTVSPHTIQELYLQRRRWYKGTVLNLYKYRDMLFNREYGDFGMFQLPSIAIGILAPFAVLALFIAYFAPPLARLFNHLYLAGLDALPKMNPGFDIREYAVSALLATDYAKIFIVVLVFLISVWLMMAAHRNTGEKISAAAIIPLIFFFIIYYIILSFMWAGSMMELALGKKRKW